MPQSKKFYIFRKLVKNANTLQTAKIFPSKTQNGDQHRIYPSLTLQTAKCFPLKRVLKKVSQKRTKLQQNKTKKRQFFLPKINGVFLSPILQNLKERSVFDNFFLKIILLNLSTSQKRCHKAKSSILSGRWSKTQNSE